MKKRRKLTLFEARIYWTYRSTVSRIKDEKINIEKFKKAIKENKKLIVENEELLENNEKLLEEMKERLGKDTIDKFDNF